MFNNTKDLVNNRALFKINYFLKKKNKYFIASILAGFYIGLGVVFILTIGSYTEYLGLVYKIFMGMSFMIGLSAVQFIGAELFTGNTFIITYGYLNKKINFLNGIKILGYSYIGNIVGSFLVASFYIFSGLNTPELIKILCATIYMKMSASATMLILRGILCNILVSIAIYGYIKLKSDHARFTLLFLSIFTFTVSGYEHSVANMTLFSIALYLQKITHVSLFDIISNLGWVSLGNIIGGCAFATIYAYLNDPSPYELFDQKEAIKIPK